MKQLDLVRSSILPSKLILYIKYFFAGNYSNNPLVFNAKENNISKVQFHLDGKEVLNPAFTMDWKNGEYERPFQALMQTMGIDRGLNGSGSCINYTNFGEDYAIFATKLRGYDGKSSGNVSLGIHFHSGPQKAISALIVGEFRAVGVLHGDGKVEDKYF